MQEIVLKATTYLKEGKLILYPTDTVWGIGCDATNPEAVKKVYTLKQRIESKALIYLLHFVVLLVTPRPAVLKFQPSISGYLIRGFFPH